MNRKIRKNILSIFLSFLLLPVLIPTAVSADEARTVLNEDGYTSSYTAVFDGFEQRPALSELLAGTEGLPAENVEITGYFNNLNATAEGQSAYAEIRGINGVYGTSRIYFSIAPFCLSNAKLIRSNVNYTPDRNALDHLLAIESEDGTYVIPGENIALRRVQAYSEMVMQSDGPARCYYINSSVIDLTADGSYANGAPNSRNDQTRYFIVSNSPNFVTDDSSVSEGYWDYGLSQYNRNNKLNEILSSLRETYFSCPDSMTITVGTFPALSLIELSADAEHYPDYDDGEISWDVSSDTEGVEIQKAVCNLIPNETGDACSVAYQIDIYFTADETYVIVGNAVCTFLSQSQPVEFDVHTQCYKASFTATLTKDAHTWTDWQTITAPTCTEAGEQVRWCINCGFQGTGAISSTGHSWSEWIQNADMDTHTRTCSNCNKTETEPCSGGTVSCTDRAVCSFCGSQYGELLDHSLIKTEAKAPTCTEDGNTEYWTCEICKKYFSDENGTKEIDLADTVEPAAGHSYKDGKCDVCGAVDSGYQPVITAGASQVWQKGVKEGLSFTSSAAFAYFQKVQVDGEDLDASCYTVKEGSTIVTLKAEYLETLSAGRHTLSIVSDTGTASTEFTIQESPASDNIQSLPTGDSTNLAFWLTLLLLSGAGATLTVILGRKFRCAK